jgi:hypothetical protein
LGERSIAEQKLMKRNKLTTMAAFCVALATFSVTTAHALTSIQVQEIKTAILGVPVPEMPAKAAELVTKAEKRDRQAVAVTAVRTVAQKHSSAAPLVVSAVSKAAPEVAPAVAVAASDVSNDQAPALARAAAISAPTRASEVVAAVSQAVPSQAATVAAAVTAAPLAAAVSPVMTRPSASSGGSSGGTVTTSNKPIGGGNFPLNGNQLKVASPQVIYNSPPST